MPVPVLELVPVRARVAAAPAVQVAVQARPALERALELEAEPAWAPQQQRGEPEVLVPAQAPR